MHERSIKAARDLTVWRWTGVNWVMQRRLSVYMTRLWCREGLFPAHTLFVFAGLCYGSSFVKTNQCQWAPKHTHTHTRHFGHGFTHTHTHTLHNQLALLWQLPSLVWTLTSGFFVFYCKSSFQPHTNTNTHTDNFSNPRRRGQTLIISDYCLFRHWHGWNSSSIARKWFYPLSFSPGTYDVPVLSSTLCCQSD